MGLLLLALPDLNAQVMSKCMVPMQECKSILGCSLWQGQLHTQAFSKASQSGHVASRNETEEFIVYIINICCFESNVIVHALCLDTKHLRCMTLTGQVRAKSGQ